MLRFVLKGTFDETMEFLKFLSQHYDSDDDKPYIMYSKDSELTISVGCDNTDYKEL